MWYWTLPSLGLTAACLIIPAYTNALGNYVDTGHLHRRNHEVDHRDYYLYLRDRRISGSEYVARGLESLDKPLDLSGLNSMLFGRERLAIFDNENK